MVAASAAMVACSSGGSGGSPGMDASSSHDATKDSPADHHAMDAAPDVVIDPKNCVPPGTPNNAAGVGGYCSPGGGQCDDGPGHASTLCTADFGTMVPPHAWFCTNICGGDAGAGACGSPGPACLPTPVGLSVCLPEMCLGLLSDGGAFGDGGTGDPTETISVGGITRSFIVHVPPSYTGATPVPLVLDFHPLDVSAAVWKSVSNWAATADAQGFIVVWPQGVMNEWNVGRCCGKVDDVAFTRALITQLEGERSIDPKRIYATGCSTGVAAPRRSSRASRHARRTRPAARTRVSRSARSRTERTAGATEHFPSCRSRGTRSRVSRYREATPT